MKIYAILTMLLIYTSFAIEPAPTTGGDAKLTNKDIINIYSTIPKTESSKAEQNKILDQAKQTVEQAKKDRETIGKDQKQRDLASQHKIDSEWTEEMTEIHKMEDDIP